MNIGRPIKSLIGNRYGKLLVIKQSKERALNGSLKWICLCECGRETSVERSNLIRGSIKSCGKCRTYNIYDLSGEYGIGEVADGRKFYFDLEDYEKISKYNWSITGNNYLINTKEDKAILMHRYILNAPENKLVDHINHNTLDNRKSNLRLCTSRQNNINKKCNGFTLRNSGKYEVSIRANSGYEYLGRFATKEEALLVRKKHYDKDHIEFEYKEELVNAN